MKGKVNEIEYGSHPHFAGTAKRRSNPKWPSRAIPPSRWATNATNGPTTSATCRRWSPTESLRTTPLTGALRLWQT
ncbi:MAG: hypothetical protein WCU80_05735 [Paludibacteraceae bacterium]